MIFVFMPVVFGFHFLIYKTNGVFLKRDDLRRFSLKQRVSFAKGSRSENQTLRVSMGFWNGWSLAVSSILKDKI